MKRNLSLWASACAAVMVMLFLAAGSLSLLGQVFPERTDVRAVFSSGNFGETFAGFAPVVLDGRTKMPIENAMIVIPETGEKYFTDMLGTAGEIRVSYRAAVSELAEKDWCEITLLVYAEGYAPYALFYLQLWEGSVRKGPTILLFPEGGEVYSIQEGMPEEWVNALVEKYRP